MTKSSLEDILKTEFNINNEEIFAKLFKYYELLIEANNTMNLTTITDIDDVYIKHFYDALLLSKCVDLNSRLRLLDIGSGAGVPGIILKICFPLVDIVLLEATTKRCNFLNEVINKLDLKNIEVVNDRAENYIANNRESFDIVTARAVANLPMLLELSAAYVKIGGFFMPLKGANINDELKNSKTAEKILKLSLEEKYKFKLPFDKGERIILKYRKMNKTNPIYPRKYNRIKDKPL